jgi:hypothetical protein
MQVGQMRPRLNGAGLMPTPGSTEWCLLLLVLAEIAALIFLRRYFGTRAHGG